MSGVRELFISRSLWAFLTLRYGCQRPAAVWQDGRIS